MNLTGNYDDMLTTVIGEHIEIIQEHQKLRDQMEEVRGLCHELDGVGHVGSGAAISDEALHKRNNAQLKVGVSKGDIDPLLHLMAMDRVEGDLSHDPDNNLYEAELVVDTGL